MIRRPQHVIILAFSLDAIGAAEARELSSASKADLEAKLAALDEDADA